jgi:hypothetical protein
VKRPVHLINRAPKRKRPHDSIFLVLVLVLVIVLMLVIK